METTTNTQCERLMQRVLDLAARGQGCVEPNPMVGAVVVREGEVIGEGWHRAFGGPHAEVEALRDCQERGHNPSGATMVVTLEPCSHRGKTPPCVDAILEAGIVRVVVAMVDPFAEVSGRGLAKLREAGIQVDVGLLEADARQINEPFIKRVTTGLPWCIAKWAQTLDGYIATSVGDSKWISNDQSRRYVHELRARVDAVIVGIGTVLADDPLLTARDVEIKRFARRVVIDPQLRLPIDSVLVRSLEDEANGPLAIAVSPAVMGKRRELVNELEARGVECIAMGKPSSAGEKGDGPHNAPPLDPTGSSSSRHALEPVLRHLVEKYQATNVLVEGGARVHAAMLAEGLIDQVLAFVAPRLLGDETALGPTRGQRRARISESDLLSLVAVERFGDDVLLDYRTKSSPDL